MEISLLRILLSNITTFINSSSSSNLVPELARICCQTIQEILKLLIPILDEFVDLKVSSNELLGMKSQELTQVINETMVLLETQKPLGSRVYFVSQLESLLSNTQTCSLEILLVLKSHPPHETISASLEAPIQKLKLMGCEEICNTVKEAIRDEAESTGKSSSDMLIKIADSLDLRTNQALLIETLALENLKKFSESIADIDPMIRLVKKIHDCFYMMKQSQIIVPNLDDILSKQSVREATAAEIRELSKCAENRIMISESGAIPLLINLLTSSDPTIQENAVTAILNLTLSPCIKIEISNALNAIESLIHVLQTGTFWARENSAAALYSLSTNNEMKMRIGRSEAIRPLIELLRKGSKDAATALFNLSLLHENKRRIVQAGGVRPLVELMEPAAGVVNKAVAVLANLATVKEGKIAIFEEGGIRGLVEVVELGSARAKEHAAAALLQLCVYSGRFCNMVLREGAVPPLVALSHSGTPRAKRKVQGLMSCFKNQRRVEKDH